jgi:hypothetical protein
VRPVKEGTVEAVVERCAGIDIGQGDAEGDGARARWVRRKTRREMRTFSPDPPSNLTGERGS